MHRIPCAALVAAILLSIPTGVLAKTYENKEHGFSIKIGGDWSQTPTRPGEDVEIAKWKDDRQGSFATMSIQRFLTAESATVTPEADGELPPAPEVPRWGPPRPKSAREALDGMVARTKLMIERNAKMTRTEIDIDKVVPPLREPKTLKLGKDRGDLYMFQVDAVPKMRFPGSFWVAAVAKRGNEEFLMIGTCAANRAKKLRGAFVGMFKTFRFLNAEDVAEIDDDDPDGRIIGGKAEDLIDLEKRERIKKDLVGDWRYIDTPHYIVIYNCDRKLAAYIARRAEYMRKYAFETVFPPLEPIKECMVMRVCKEMDEYYHYGAPRGSAGYWSSGHDELVFPDLSRSKNADEKTAGVLHHEGFHQYIFYCLLKHNPPVWFNEGSAEYFFCVNYKSWSKKLIFEKRHPMRYGTLKTKAGSGGLIPLKDFIKLSHGQYMQRAQLCYTQGWAFITWCKNVTRNERYRQIPDIYFNELQKGYAEQRGAAGGLPGGMPMGRNNPVTQQALEKAFEGIDLDQLHKDFLNDVKRRM